MPPLLESRSTGQVAFESSIATAQLVVSIFGNLLLLIALYRKPRLSNATNIFIASLAATDLLNACIPGTLFLYSLLTGEMWINRLGCQVGGFFFFYCNNLSAMIMGLTAINRYFCMFKPNTCKTLFSFRRSLYYLVVLWLSDAILVGFPIVFDLAAFEFKPLVNICTIVFYDSAQQKAYSSSMVLTMVVITTLTFCYYRISKFLRQHQVNMSASPHTNLSVQEIKITKTLLILVLVYVLLWIPSVIITILFRVVLPQDISREVTLANPYLLFTSGALNPFIYGFTNRLLRKKIKNIFRRNQIQPLNNAGGNFRAGERRFQQALPRENIALNVLERPREN